MRKHGRRAAVIYAVFCNRFSRATLYLFYTYLNIFQDKFIPISMRTIYVRSESLKKLFVYVKKKNMTASKAAKTRFLSNPKNVKLSFDNHMAFFTHCYSIFHLVET